MAAVSSSTFIATSTAHICADWVVDPRHTLAAVEKATLLIPDLTAIVASYLKMNWDSFFGKEHWDSLCEKGFCGRVDPAPPFPIDIENVLQSRCIFHKPLLVKDTHILVYVPKIIDGKPLTFNLLGEIAKCYFPATNAGYRYIFEGIVDKLGDKSVDRACWVLMTKSILPNSINKDFSAQQTMIVDFVKKSLIPYEIPETLPAAVCILSQYFSSFNNFKTYLFSDNSLIYTRCQEEIEGNRMVVGKFSSAGLSVNLSNRFAHPRIGVAALWKF